MNLFAGIPAELPRELSETLVSADHVRIERIVSFGQLSPSGFWYDQDEHEWVVLLAGSATLEFDDGQSVSLSAGDYLSIPAHRRHRVAATSHTAPTIWLAVFYR